VRSLRESTASLLSVAFIPLFGLLVVARGRNADWDFRNYHWYNPYAWLTGRRGFDVAVAHHATYYNPLPDVPAYLGAQVLPGWAVAFLLGCVHALNLVLVYRIARHALDAQANTGAEWIALALAVAGTTGGMALVLVGNPSNDLTVSVLVLFALLTIVRGESNASRDSFVRFVLAGLLCGSAIGLKLTMAPFAFGLAAGVLAMRAPLRVRLARTTALGVGGVIGALAFGGAWAFALWRETGNPFFPYFNDLIGSPLILEASYRDERFLPHGFVQTLLYPFIFAMDGMRVNDFPFRDVKIALAYALVPLALVWYAVRQPRWPLCGASVDARTLSAASGRRAITPTMQLLFVFAIVSYVAWVAVFGVYRYIVTLEMLAPLLIALALSLVIANQTMRALALAALWVIAVVGTDWRTVGFGTVSGGWRGGYVDVSYPPLADPTRTLVVMAGIDPMGYVVPSFPPQVAFVRIDGWLDSPQSHSVFGDQMRARIDAHKGPIFGMFAEHERDRAIAAFDADGLVPATSECDTITSNVGEPLQWCALKRK
jgi:hypothetical protein